MKYINMFWNYLKRRMVCLFTHQKHWEGDHPNPEYSEIVHKCPKCGEKW